MELTENLPSTPSILSPTFSLQIVNKSRKCVCKIKIKSKSGFIMMSTGFFMKVSNSSRYLISCYHSIGDAIKNNTEIEVEIWNETRIILTSNGRFTKIFKELDIAVIEMKNSDNIFNVVEYFDYDKNYIEGYKIYENVNVFSIQYAYGREESYSSGKIREIENFHFYHDCSEETGSSTGSPIILTNTFKVIGIHIAFSPDKKLNVGTFIGEIIKEIDLPYKMNNNIQNNNKNKIFQNNNNIIINNKNYNINNKISNKVNNKINNNIDNKINNENNNKINTNINNIINTNIYNFNNNNSDNKSQNSINKNSINKEIDLNIDITKDDKNGPNSKEDKKEIITIYIQLSDQSLNCKIRCRRNDIFNKIINIIVKKEPTFIEKIGYFLCNGNKINEYKSIKDNGIKDCNVIILNVAD